MTHAEAHETNAPRPRVGRPRKAPSSAVGVSPREEILQAAIPLFAAGGFAGTSTHQIARRVGVSQSALFHHFLNKQAILEEIVERELRKSLDFYETLDRRGAPPSIRLYEAILNDVTLIAGYSKDVKSILMMPELRQDRFAHLLECTRLTIEWYRGVHAEGVQAGEFRPDDSEFLGWLLNAVNEMAADTRPFTPGLSPTRYAQNVAAFTLRAILVDPDRLDAVRAEATSSEGG